MLLKRGFVLLMLLILGMIVAYADEDNDGVPDNCEYRYGEFYRQNIFARYEAQNRRLVLVDWSNGNDLATLATDIDATLIQGWSANCQYLAVATGDNSERTTVVYDTLSLERIGEVSGASGAAHRIHWGPNEYLVVESKDGAVLWDVTRRIQYRFDTGFNTTTYRNYDSLRWDIENNQLIATLSVGGRRVYDLNTGEETISAASPAGMIALGGNLYPCVPQANRYAGRTYAVNGVRLAYDAQAKLISLSTNGYISTSLETLEAGVETIHIQTLGWSANCRYVAGALLVAESSDNTPAIYDTVVWDVANKRRVGVFPDAHRIPHPIAFDTAEKHLMIQTRKGAYLWNLETNIKVLVNETVEAPPFGCRYQCQPRSFHSIFWDAGRQQFLGVAVQEPNKIIAYDANTGEVLEQFIANGISKPLAFITSNDSRYIAAYAQETVTFWDRTNGNVVQFPAQDRDMLISPDSKYFVMMGYPEILVWNISELSNGGTASYTIDSQKYNGSWSNIFINNRVISNQSSYSPQTINIETGEITRTTFDAESQSPIAFNTISGLSGYGTFGRSNWISYRNERLSEICTSASFYNGEERKLYVRDIIKGGKLLVAEDVNAIQNAQISPDCQYIYGNESYYNEDLPYREAAGPRDTRFGLWEIATGKKIVEFESNTRTGSISWSPTNDRAIVYTASGAYLVQPQSNFFAPLTFLASNNPRVYTKTYWDYARGLVYVQGCDAVNAFDMTTGEERIHLSANNNGYSWCYGAVGFQVLEDGWIKVVSGGTAIWNIDSLEHVYIPMAKSQTYLSPDKRHVVMASAKVYVWDFQTGELVVEHGVSYSRVLTVSFIDNNTIEITRWNREATGRETALYDLTTGTLIE